MNARLYTVILMVSHKPMYSKSAHSFNGYRQVLYGNESKDMDAVAFPVN